MCQFPLTGLMSLCGKATRNFSQSWRSSLLSACTTRTMGPSLCNSTLPTTFLLCYARTQPWYQPTCVHTWASVGSTSYARGGLGCWLLAVDCWLLAVGWPLFRPRTPSPAASPESSVVLFLKKFVLSHGRI